MTIDSRLIADHDKVTHAIQCQRCQRMNTERSVDYAAEAVTLDEMAKDLGYNHPSWLALIHGASALRDSSKYHAEQAVDFFRMYVDEMNREAHRLDLAA